MPRTEKYKLRTLSRLPRMADIQRFIEKDPICSSLCSSDIRKPSNLEGCALQKRNRNSTNSRSKEAISEQKHHQITKKKKIQDRERKRKHKTRRRTRIKKRSRNGKNRRILGCCRVEWGDIGRRKGNTGRESIRRLSTRLAMFSLENLQDSIGAAKRGPRGEWRRITNPCSSSLPLPKIEKEGLLRSLSSYE